MMPTHPTACLIMSQTDFTFCFLENFFDVMPTAADINQLPQFNRRRRVAEVVARAFLLVQRAQDDQGFQRPRTAIIIFGLHACLDGLYLERAFGTMTHGYRFPAVG